MAAQNHKKDFSAEFVTFLNANFPQTHLIKALNSLHCSIPNGRLSENPEKGGFRELYLPKNDFKTCSTVNFPKKYMQILEAWRPMEDMKFRLEFFFTCSSTYELIIKKLFWTLNRNI